MTGFEINIGFYTGILFGVRSYPDIDTITHALYIPFVSLHLVIEYN